jgi:HEAT repeat protein
MRQRKLLVILPCLLALCLSFLAFRGCEKTKSAEELIAGLKSPQEKDRIIAVRNMPVQTKDAALIVPALIDALKDKHRDIRISAAIKLGSFGEYAKEAIPALQAALQDRDPQVREAAGIAISRIDPNAAPKTTPSQKDAE